MQFCKSLGERYLWVDRLCIVQDDMDSWSESAAIMDVIYANSALNICAASGCDSEAGLPGLYGQTRRTNQHVETLAGMDVVATRIPEVDIARSNWNSRAWAFQERLLARKAIIFTANRAFFQCRAATWSEEIDADGENLSWTLDMIDVPLSLVDGNPVRHYSNCVMLYTLRKLTFSRDMLYAFEGIANSLQEPLGCRFLSGLPTAVFDWSMLWEPVEPLQRRDGFPSFSWCGWEGGVYYRLSTTSGCLLNLHEWLANRTWVNWLHFQVDGSLAQVWDASQEDSPVTPRTVRGRWRGYRCNNAEEDHDTYGRTKHEHHPLTQRAPSYHGTQERDPKIDLLVFFTYSAFFTLSRKNMSAGHFTSKLHPGLHRLGILDNKGDWCGTILLDDRWLGRIGQPLEFIAISEARDISLEEYDSWTYYVPRDREQSEWDLYFALLVQKTGNGHYERAGLAKIFKSAFHAHSHEPGNEWKQIVLG